MRLASLRHLPRPASLVVVAALFAGCGDGGDRSATPDAAAMTAVVAVPVTTGAAAAGPDTTQPVGPGGTVPLSPLAGLVRPLGPATYDPAEHARPVAPLRLGVEGIGADDVVVRSVGLEPNGEMEVPPPDEVGWYRNSVTPGAPGSSVLAGHIAFDGRPGAFRALDGVALGARVTVELADGAVRSFTVTAVDRYRKDALPLELFRTEGDPVLTLITCGGTFQPSLRSYDSNIVVTAVPV